MTFARKALYFRLAVALLVFLLIWLLLALTSTLWLDKAAITSEIDDKLGIKFLNPNLQGIINTHGWEVLASLIVAVTFYFKAKEKVISFLSDRLDKGDPLVVGWWKPVMDIDAPTEYLLDTLAYSWSPVIRIENKGHKTMKIERIEASVLVTRQLRLNDGQEFEELVEEVELSTQSEAEDLIRWTQIGPNRWSITGLPSLLEKYHFLLPTIDIRFDNENTDIIERIQLLAGNPTLNVRATLLFFFPESTVSRKLEVPLRIFSPYEEWEEEDHARELVDKLALPADERDRLCAGYHVFGTVAQKGRENWAIQGRQAAEKKKLIEFRHELEPYDHNLEVDPNDVPTHFERGEWLLDHELYYEALASFQRAEALGLNTDQLQVMIALSLLALDRNDEVLTVLEKVTDPDAQGAGFFATRGRALYEKQQYDAARTDLQRAIELDPKSYLSYVFLCFTIKAVDPFEPSDMLKLVQCAVDNGYTDRNMIENLSKFVGDPEHSAILRLAENMPDEAP